MKPLALGDWSPELCRLRLSPDKFLMILAIYLKFELESEKM